MNNECVFCKIIAGQIPAKIVQETDDIIVIQDIQPKARVHYLIIPKKHIAKIQSCTQQDQALLGSIMLMAQKLSENLAGSQEFKLISNNGSSVGQSVFHIHMHFLSGSSFQNYEV